MRDIVLTVFIFGALPFILTRPYVGVLLWTWVGLMNPHRLTWSFAYAFPFAQWIGVVTLLALLISKEDKRIPWTPVTVALAIFSAWVTVTTIFALTPDSAWPQWEKVIKIQLMIFVTMMVMKDKARINWLVWVAAMSIGYYGIKGGIFTIIHGGKYQVLGPAGTFIGGNTSLALAMVMVIPLMWYLRIASNNAWVRWGMLLAAALTALSVIGSYSRGGLLAIIAMSVFLWLKSPKRGLLTVVAIVAIPFVMSFMPDKWFDRMETIETYKEDSSAMSRINAWTFAFNLAKDYPVTGGGFETFRPSLFAIYAPVKHTVDAHSIYFEVLAEHGFVGLFLFLMIMWLGWRTGTWIIRNAKDNQELEWAGDLARMVQAGLVGYWVAGAFLGLAYFDLYYVLLAILVVVRAHVEQKVSASEVAIGTHQVKQHAGGFDASRNAGSVR